MIKTTTGFSAFLLFLLFFLLYFPLLFSAPVRTSFPCGSFAMCLCTYISPVSHSLLADCRHSRDLVALPEFDAEILPWIVQIKMDGTKYCSGEFTELKHFYCEETHVTTTTTTTTTTSSAAAEPVIAAFLQKDDIWTLPDSFTDPFASTLGVFTVVGMSTTTTTTTTTVTPAESETAHGPYNLVIGLTSTTGLTACGVLIGGITLCVIKVSIMFLR